MLRPLLLRQPRGRVCSRQRCFRRNVLLPGSLGLGSGVIIKPRLREGAQAKVLCSSSRGQRRRSDRRGKRARVPDSSSGSIVAVAFSSPLQSRRCMLLRGRQCNAGSGRWLPLTLQLLLVRADRRGPSKHKAGSFARNGRGHGWQRQCRGRALALRQRGGTGAGAG